MKKFIKENWLWIINLLTSSPEVWFRDRREFNDRYKNKPLNLKYLFIVIVLAAIVGGGAIYCQYISVECNSPADCEGKTHVMCVGQWECINNQCSWNCQVEEEQELEETELEDETANWQICRNEKYNFEFKHPLAFKPDPLDTEFICSGDLKIGDVAVLFGLSVEKTEYKDIDTWFDNYRLWREEPYFYEGLKMDAPKIISVEDVIIGGYKGKKTVIEGLAYYNGGTLNIIKDGYLYNLSTWKKENFNQEEKKVINQMLSTFRFIE